MRHLLGSVGVGRSVRGPFFARHPTGTLLGNPIYQAFVKVQSDCHPFNSLGAGVVNKRQYKTI